MRKRLVVTCVVAVAVALSVTSYELRRGPVWRVVDGLSRAECHIANPDHDGGLVAIGDSITSGSSDPRLGLLSDESWLSHAVCSPGLDVAYGNNAGRNQNTTEQMLDRYDRDVTVYKPAVVVISGGTNDVLGGTPTSETLANLAEMMDRAEASGAVAVLGTIPPRDRDELDEATLALNAAVRDLADRRSWPLIDFFEVLAAGDDFATGLTEDGTHPTPEAARMMAEAARLVLNDLATGR